MDKFSFFDFLAYVIPGGTLLLALYGMSYDCVPCIRTLPIANSAYMILPFLFLAYILGHLISYAGMALEDACYENRPVFSVFARKRPHDALVLDELSNKYFGFRFMKEGKAEEADIKLFFHKVTDYLEVHNNDNITIIFNSQHAFFRNSILVLMLVCVVACAFSILHVAGTVFPSVTHPIVYPITAIAAGLLCPACIFLSYQIRLNYIRYSFQMFIASVNEQK
jgi:hypothetical protein